MKKKIAIFGAGITGLAAARNLADRGHEVDVYESSDRIGGLAKTFQDADGFTYDNGPRFIFSTLAEKLGIQDICEPVQYYEFLYVKDKKYRFPFGFIKNPKYCVSIGTAMLTRGLKKKPQNLEEFLQIYYGKTFSKDVLQPLIEKWSGTPAKLVSLDFASRLLPTNISYIIYSLIKKLRGGVTEDFYKKERYIVYPKGSNAKIFEALTKNNNYSIHLDSPMTEIEHQNDTVMWMRAGSKVIDADYYISTIPVSRLSKMINHASVQDWNHFKYRLIRILFIKLDQERVIDGLWHWFPENLYPFYRVSEYKNARRELAPAGKTAISLEIALSPEDPLVRVSDHDLFEAVFPYLEHLYQLNRSKVISVFSHTSETAYPVLRKDTENAQRALQHQTPLKNLFIAGRTGMFQYKMTEGSYDSAIDCANIIHALAENKSIDKLQNRYNFSDSYGRPNQIPE